MSGNPINETQRRIYMSLQNQGKAQITSAVKAGISERSGRRIENNDTRFKNVGAESISAPCCGQTKMDF